MLIVLNNNDKGGLNDEESVFINVTVAFGVQP